MDQYIGYFATLHTNTQKGVKAPHKAIMLLSVIDLVEYGVITSNQIEFSERLEQQFQHNWSRYVGQSDVFQPRVGTPFWHLNNEPFWRLVPYEGGDEAVVINTTTAQATNTIQAHILQSARANGSCSAMVTHQMCNSTIW